MRIVFATTLTVAVLTLTTGGCGSISSVSDGDGGNTGEAGTTGQAGTTGGGGRAGNAGPAGASGQAGSSGVAGSNTGVAGSNTGVAGTTGVAGSTTGIAGTTGVAGSGSAGRGGSTGVAGSTTGVAGSGSGRGGSTGVAGTTGVAGSGSAGRGGSTGVAGSGSGQAGSAGPGGTGGQAPAPACPFKVPADGGTCLREGIICEYGDDPRGDKCRTILTCSDSHWKVTNKPDCPDIQYPACGTRPGEVCSPAGSYCLQSDGAACNCTTCPGNGICLPGTKPTLYCTMPSSQGCPAGEPNMGTSCDIEKLECMYCPDTSRVCYKGIWTPSNQPCPIAAGSTQ